MQRALGLLLLAACASTSTRRVTTFEREADDIRRTLHISGMSAVIVQNQEVLWTGDIGRRMESLPPPWDAFHQNARRIWDRAATLVTAGIEIGIRGKAPRIQVHPVGASATAHLRNE